MNFRFRKNDLIKVLLRVGFSKTESGASRKLNRLKKLGKFVPPQDAGIKGRWVFTDSHLVDISKHLGPGGNGEWKYPDQV